MSNIPSAAESIDAHKLKLAVLLLCISVLFGIQAVSFLVNEETRSILRTASGVLVALNGLLIIRMVVWKIGIMWRISKEQRHLFFNPEGYVVEARNSAAYFSWVLSFMALIIMIGAAEDNATSLPPEFFILALLFLMLSSFSLSFLYLWLIDSKEESDALQV